MLELFRDASERPDGIVHPSVNRNARRYYLHQLGTFAWLALLEGSRLEEQGDMEEAWKWYRAVFRMKVHAMRRGSIFQRFVADSSCKWLHMRIASWAADRRTGVPLLRRALADIKAGEPKPEWDAFSLKVDYLEMMTELDKEWGGVQRGDNEDQHVLIFGEPLPPVVGWVPYAARRYFLNEPERSRRVLRSRVCELVGPRRGKRPAASQTSRSGDVRRREADPDGAFLCGQPGWAGRRAENAAASPGGVAHRHSRRETASFVLALAVDTHDRAPGTPCAGRAAGRRALSARARTAAPSDEAPLGPYLDHLPDDGSEELDDGKAPYGTGC